MGSIVQSTEPITLIGGGDVDASQLSRCLEIAPQLVAADGGANGALEFGAVPQAVIGDLDSITSETLIALESSAVHRIAEQDSTDFDKALRHIDAPVVLAVGFTGARMDHQLAAFHTLIAHPNRPCIIIGAIEVVFLCPPELTLDLPEGEVFSLFPMGSVTGASMGLRWPIEGLRFGPDQRIGTSNEITGPLRLTMDSPKMLCIAPVAALDEIVVYLNSSGARWPVPER